mmetsp:Transcript_80973/g.261635  ORF Transcript_80973/g.261635 Transcript_80973/m.261635 type:complete len:131 (-) Transcript_80973:99-491(-)
MLSYPCQVPQYGFSAFRLEQHDAFSGAIKNAVLERVDATARKGLDSWKSIAALASTLPTPHPRLPVRSPCTLCKVSSIHLTGYVETQVMAPALATLRRSRANEFGRGTALHESVVTHSGPSWLSVVPIFL